MEKSHLFPGLKFKTNYNVYAMFLKQKDFEKPYLVTEDTYRPYSKLISARTISSEPNIGITL
jgi:hypothetical protein